MTINYHKEIMTSHPWTFFLLLFKWKGSIWKAVYMETIIFLICYGIISVIYKTAMGESSQRTFESLVRYFDKRLSYIPLEFVLGFFVTTVVNRWTKLYQTIGFIDNVGLMANCYIRGATEKARIYRRNIMRYCELVQILVFRDMSMRTRRRFPTMETVVAAGFMNKHELELYNSYDTKYNSKLGTKYWIPANWALCMTYKARKDGYIESDYFKAQMEGEIRTWRTNIEWVCNYDWVPLPLMYPQLVCLAVNLYFLVSIIARQLVIEKHKMVDEVDVYFPVMTFLQFIFYMGWLKVIDVMLNPFGEDDDDFETNALIDRNITMGLMIADNPMSTPELRKDPFYDEVDVPLLYSEESSNIPNHHYHGSVSEVRLEQKGNAPVMMMPHSQSAANLRRMMSFKSVDEDEKDINAFSMSHDDARMRNWREVSLDSSFLADLNENKEWKIPTNPQKF
ncbi:Bestrophin homolog 1 [Caenorhabditis elegans]|uniref:Bestrophin homolog 1 n=1 Tax=Caenorhabditis elegans TaxID=6239 RepID=BEST1_CAEEL|nr:Bestrophin homolog 1 [Caenorhabditis elegans]Q17528.1 RecName: Full=Bestrophin homolog 1 [Caenorhabditis elegans]CAA97765.1 Bestrophin homolog 1 [Caenorhabditis elegans]|eukprot:NP_502523.1 Bestrophin homolog 1 [Caenorhabditis elegans]